MKAGIMSGLLGRRTGKKEENHREDGNAVEIRWLGPNTVQIIGGEKPDPNYVPPPFFDSDFENLNLDHR